MTVTVVQVSRVLSIALLLAIGPACFLIQIGQEPTYWGVVAAWAAALMASRLAAGTWRQHVLVDLISIVIVVGLAHGTRQAWAGIAIYAQNAYAANRVHACRKVIGSLTSKGGVQPTGAALQRAWALEPMAAQRPFYVPVGPENHYGLEVLPDARTLRAEDLEPVLRTVMPSPGPAMRGKLVYVRLGAKGKEFLLVGYGWRGQVNRHISSRD